MDRYRRLTPGQVAFYGFFGVVFAALAIIGFIGLQAWLLMLFLGVLHLHLSATIPALGFLQSFLAIVAINLVQSWLRNIFKPKAETK